MYTKINLARSWEQNPHWLKKLPNLSAHPYGLKAAIAPNGIAHSIDKTTAQ